MTLHTQRQSHLTMIVTGSKYSAAVAPGNDHDWFKVNFIDKHEYEIRVESTNTNSGEDLDPIIVLRDYSGGSVNSGSKDSTINYISEYIRRYYIDVGSYAENSSGNYSVLVTDVT
ncbi:protein of unknown function [Rhodovastum atsumiense]|nr:protein of unknown function [Rhodovastum atsumiense]